MTKGPQKIPPLKAGLLSSENEKPQRWAARNEKQEMKKGYVGLFSSVIFHFLFPRGVRLFFLKNTVYLRT